MAENLPNAPSGAVPPKKETGKVQPKKETVRINLPPKPSAAPTIKLPTLPPGGPSAVPGAPPAFSAPAATAAHAPAPRAAAAPAAAGAPAPRGAAPAPATPRPAPAPAAGPRRVSALDTALAIVAAVAALAAIGTTVYIYLLLTNANAG